MSRPDDMDSLEEQLESLRRCNRGLVALSTIHALWTGREPAQIVRDACDALSSLLRLDLAYVRATPAAGDEPIEIARTASDRCSPELAGQVAEALRPLIEGKARDARIVDPAFDGEMLAVAAPLRYEGEMGVFVACSARPDFPNEIDRLLLMVGANQTSVAIYEARLRTALRVALGASQAGADSLDAINRVGQTLVAELDMHRLLQIFTDEATRITGAQFGAFFYNALTEQGEAYMLYTISGVPREHFDKFPMPRKTELFGPTFSGEAVMRIDDVTKDPRYGKNPPYNGMPKGHLPVCSYLAVPVISRTREVLGGLFFGHSKPGVFTEHHERMMLGIAGQAAVAIDNARLFEVSERERRAAEEARQRAEEANRAKDEFLAVVSHELRTPLNSMLGWTRLLRSGTLSGEAIARGLETIERNTLSQAQLIEDLLDISRITTGKLQLSVESVDLASVAEAAVESLRFGLEAKGIDLRMEVDPEAARVTGDRVRLQQVIWNLLSNAIKFTPKGGLVRLTMARRDGQTEITVADTGQGIAPEFMPYVFDRFRQADTGITRRFGGLGLGLAIVRHIVELHGGTVRAESDGPGCGASFVVRLPVARTRARKVAAGVAGPSFDGSLPRLAARVLIVDDEPDTREMLSAILAMAGAEVRAVEGLVEALGTLDEWVPDVIVSDIGMPGADGYELMKSVRQRPESQGGRVPAVALTAYARVEDRLRALASGFQSHVAKPVEPVELVAVIQSLLERGG